MKDKEWKNIENVSNFKASNWLLGVRNIFMVSWRCAYLAKLVTFLQKILLAWIERLTKFYRPDDPKNILKLNELGLFFNPLPEKSEKSKTNEGGRKVK